MTIALFVTNEEASFWNELLSTAVADSSLKVEIFERPLDAMQILCLECYDSIWVVLSGAKGLDTIALLRRRSRNVPLVWVTSDSELMAVGYDYRVSDCINPQQADIKRLTKAFENIRRYRNDFARNGT